MSPGCCLPSLASSFIDVLAQFFEIAALRRGSRPWPRLQGRRAQVLVRRARCAFSAPGRRRPLADARSPSFRQQQAHRAVEQSSTFCSEADLRPSGASAIDAAVINCFHHLRVARRRQRRRRRSASGAVSDRSERVCPTAHAQLRDDACRACRGTHEPRRPCSRNGCPATRPDDWRAFSAVASRTLGRRSPKFRSDIRAMSLLNAAKSAAPRVAAYAAARTRSAYCTVRGQSTRLDGIDTS